MRNPNNISPNDNKSNGNWLGDDVPEFNGDEDGKTETERARDYFREQYFSKEYRELMSPFIQKLNPGRIKSFNEKILSNDEREYRWGYMQIVYDIADILGLENRPEVMFPNLSDSKKEELGLDRTDAFYNEGTDSIYILNLKDNNHYNKINSIIKTVSHEMWHKHQHDEVNKGGARADIYRKNFDNYIDDQEDLYGYATQPVEIEAYIFESKFAHAFRHILIDSLQSDIDEYNEKVLLGKYTNPPDENHKYIYDRIAEQMKKANDQLDYLRQIKDWDDEIVSCSQAKQSQ